MPGPGYPVDVNHLISDLYLTHSHRDGGDTLSGLLEYVERGDGILRCKTWNKQQTH